MQMDSPIDERVWKYMFHGMAAVATAAITYSLWREKRDKGSKLNDAFTALKDQDPEQALNAMDEINRKLSEEADSGVSIIAVRNNVKQIISKLKFIKTSENKPCFAALQLSARLCSEPEGRLAFFKAGGYREVLLCLATAHSQGQVKLMEEAAKTLDDITTIDENEIVHATDVPAGTEGCVELSKIGSTVSMLRTLDPGARPEYLIHVTGTFANITAVRAGSNAIKEGTSLTSGGEKKAGIYFFLQLLAHRNVTINENAARVCAHLVNHGPSQHKVMLESEEYVANLCLLLRKSSNSARCAMRIIYMMQFSPLAKEFFEKLDENHGLSFLFRVWISKQNEHEKPIRGMAEALVHHLESHPFCSTRIRELMDINRSDIHHRRSEDEAMKRQMQAERQKQQGMMQQMMMRQAMESGMGMEEMQAAMGGM